MKVEGIESLKQIGKCGMDAEVICLKIYQKVERILESQLILWGY